MEISGARAELTSSEWHDFGSRQSGFAVTMRAEMSEGKHKVFLWTSGNRFRPDVTRTIKFMPFPSATGTFVFLVLEGIMKSKVFRKETAHFQEARVTGMLKP